ncbi:hypothetical protein Tco_1110371 [Tanacetum coccineum]|uniref:Uncharacterized protein n=1 Tax=Tanacetum coccineum TaxID=301880 RepID=A0ABQ5IKR0_9ASTR
MLLGPRPTEGSPVASTTGKDISIASSITGNNLTTTSKPRQLPQKRLARGDDLERWIFAITEYFSLLNTPADQRLRIVGLWRVLRKRFGPSKFEDPQGALSKLLQLGMVEDYQREFKKLMNKVTDIPDSLLISFYISGLKLHLQRELLASKPITLGYVFWLARIIEARLEDKRSTTTIAKPSDLNTGVQVQHLEETTFHKSNKVEETKARVEATAKRSLDANEEVKKAYTRVHGLEKQVEKLPMELQLNHNFREALETRTKRALKISDEKFKKAKSEATTKIRKLTEVYGAWLPPWLAAHLVVYQSYVKNYWKESMFIQRRIWDPGIKIFLDDTLRARWFRRNGECYARG